VRRRGSDQPPDATEPEDGPLVDDEQYPVDRLRARVSDSLGDRPFTVYLVLFAGAATLLLLLAVVWISATNDGDGNDPFCTEISPADARSAVLAGEVERVNILVDDDRPTDSLTGIQLSFADETCRQTPQGADIRDQLYSIIGAVGLYNNFSDTSIDVRYQEQEIQPELLATSIPTVLATATATVTPPTKEASPVDPIATDAPPTEVPTVTVQAPLAESPTATAPSVPTDTPGADGQDSLPVGNPGA
jgi:hypothetical protein